MPEMLPRLATIFYRSVPHGQNASNVETNEWEMNQWQSHITFSCHSLRWIDDDCGQCIAGSNTSRCQERMVRGMPLGDAAAKGA